MQITKIHHHCDQEGEKGIQDSGSQNKSQIISKIETQQNVHQKLIQILGSLNNWSSMTTIVLNQWTSSPQTNKANTDSMRSISKAIPSHPTASATAGPAAHSHDTWIHSNNPNDPKISIKRWFTLPALSNPALTQQPKFT